MKCLACNGKGGEYDAILWDGPGGGSYEQCCYCKGEGEISLFKWLYWKLCIVGKLQFIDGLIGKHI